MAVDPRALRELQFNMRQSNKEEITSSKLQSTDKTETGDVNGSINCNICGFLFEQKTELMKHMKKHTLDAKSASNNTTNTAAPRTLSEMNKCKFCGQLFYEANDASTHLRTIHLDKLQEDSEAVLESRTIDQNKINQHKRVEYMHQAKKHCYEEKYTGEGVTSKIELVRMDSVLQCEFCEYIFRDTGDLFTHTSAHTAEHHFSCQSCNFHAATVKNISYHFLTECVFARETLKKHGTNPKRFFVCNICFKYFTSIDKLYDHRHLEQHYFARASIRAEGEYVFCCEGCEKNFKRPGNLKWHYVAKHSGNGNNNSIARTYLCEICGKIYKQSGHLYQHLRFHNGIKPFACTVAGCNRKFTVRQDLNDHNRKCHTGERPFQCMDCGKRFLTGSVYYTHRHIHSGERRHECMICKKRFLRLDALKTHSLIHTGEKPFGCELCPKQFRQRVDLNKHVRARHPTSDIKERTLMQKPKVQPDAAEVTKNEAID